MWKEWGNHQRFMVAKHPPPASLLPLPSLSHVGLVQQLDLLTVPRVVPRLPQAVLPVRLHGVGYGDVDALHLWVAAAGDEQGVRGRLTQVAGHEAVLPA